MVISTEDIYALCLVISKQRNLEVCVTESAKAGMITGGATFVSALMLGPLAIVPAAVASGVIASKLANKFQPLYKILYEMSNEDKQKLCQHLRNIIALFDIGDAMALAAIASAPSSEPYKAILAGMGHYFKQKW